MVMAIISLSLNSPCRVVGKQSCWVCHWVSALQNRDAGAFVAGDEYLDEFESLIFAKHSRRE
jgi:hypothetical protein